MALRISLDRNLPVSISAQLQGEIEYGIASGALRPGEQLPSVRELAAKAGVAHVTVSHVYRTLKKEGVIVVRPGMGTYVADQSATRSLRELEGLQRLVDLMANQAIERGFTPAEISHMVTAQLASRRRARPVIALVGMFGHATEVYAREILAQLPAYDPEVVTYTIERLRSSGVADRARVCEADVILTIAHRVREVQLLLPRHHPPVRGLTFVAHDETIRLLGELPEGIQLGVITTFAEFLPTMLQGVMKYSSATKPPVCAVLSDVERVDLVLTKADAVIYASGSETVTAHVPYGIPAIEFLHTPERSSVEAIIPLLQRATPGENNGQHARQEKR